MRHVVYSGDRELWNELNDRLAYYCVVVSDSMRTCGVRKPRCGDLLDLGFRMSEKVIDFFLN
jgi:hypothetical protein